MLTPSSYDRLPEHMRDGMRRWIEHGILPGSFLTAVLENDLRASLGQADSVNRERLFDFVSFLHNVAPSSCWGSPEKVTAWKAAGGLSGHSA